MSASPRARAFTLIELLIAIALGMVVLLVAMAGFRMASKAISGMNRMSRENALLRTGYFLAVEDADFWHSHANPQFPYLKGYMSDDVPGPEGDGNVLENVRVFRPVTFQQGGHFDPNWTLPHDRRSWYRNTVVQMPRPWNYKRYDGERQAFAEVENYGWKDWYSRPRVQVKYGAQDGGPEVEQMWPVDSYLLGDGSRWPLGWEPRNVLGDYAMVSHLGEAHRPDVKAASATPEDRINRRRGARPALIWDIFQELGHIGVYTYMPAGTPQLILRPNANADDVDDGDVRDVDKVGKDEWHFDKGEVPWSLGRPFAKDKNGKEEFTEKMENHFINPYTLQKEKRIVWYKLDMRGAVAKVGASGASPTKSQLLRGNYFFAMPGQKEQDAATWRGTYRQHWLIDLDNMSRGRGWVHDGQTATVNGMIIGSRMVPTNWDHSLYSSGPMVDQPHVEPWVAVQSWIWSHVSFTRDGSEDLDLNHGDFQRLRDDLTTTTWHLPQAYTDATKPDLLDRPAGMSAMGTSIFRRRVGGHDRADCVVRVQDPVSGQHVELRFPVIATTLRGARQHWGWKSSVDRPDLKPMGDRYAK